MSVPVRLALSGLFRAPGRTLGTAARPGGRDRPAPRSMILFYRQLAEHTMTGGAVRSVPLDWRHRGAG